MTVPWLNRDDIPEETPCPRCRRLERKLKETREKYEREIESLKNQLQTLKKQVLELL